MSPKQLIFHDAARDKIRHAAESLAVAVINTLHKERELANSDYEREKLVEPSRPSSGYNAASRICFKLPLKRPHANQRDAVQRRLPHPLLGA
jgi:hypothetical protein